VAELASRRPPLNRRKFTSEAVEATISQVTNTLADRELAWIFENCFPNTLDTTVHYGSDAGKPDTFVITGDIHAMWLRDSSAQVWPYLPLAQDDRKLRDLIAGVIRRQARCILIDPYANAFNDGPGASEWVKDLTEMKPELHERKYEIDSLCYPVRLAYGYWKTTGDASPFDARWRQAMVLAVKTLREQQRMDSAGPYKFQRVSAVPYDTVYLGGYGNPSRRCGLVHSAFRPSDDSCFFPFLIPSNMFAVVALRALSEIADDVLDDQAFASECSEFAHELEGTIKKHAVMTHPAHGPIFAYEVDGFGNALFMDDANVPSLLALPYLGWCPVDEPTYKATRGFLLSDDNPYFFRGRAGEGIGGPHVGVNWIWPMAIIVRALTSTDDREIVQCLKTLKATHAGTGFMHESFHKDDPTQFTRAWFAWANTLFGELILRLRAERPAILSRPLT
jgi:meiotically up-regulated gene 157 (Mug157) protein